MWFYIMIVSLLLVLMWLTQVREGFLDLPDLKTLPDPQKLLKEMRVLLDRYDNPILVTWDIVCDNEFENEVFIKLPPTKINKNFYEMIKNNS